MAQNNMRLVDWLDDLCVRFIVNLPHEELQVVERICFQIEEAQWFYEDFIRPLDPNLPSLNLRRFALLMFQHCPLSSNYSSQLHLKAYEDFLAYKTRVPVRGAIMLNHDMTQAVLVKGWKKGAKWSFPRGKINKNEADLDCAVREVYEETGYDLREADLVRPDEQMKKIGVSMREQDMMLYVFRGVPMDTHFEPRTRKEISKIGWYKLTDLPTQKRKNHIPQGTGQDLIKENNFYMVAPFLGPLKGWIKQQRKLDQQKAKAIGKSAPPATAGATDNDEVEAEAEDTTADEAPIPDRQPSNVSGNATFADLVANLGRGHRPSDTLPEVSALQEIPQIQDAAAELKRLLSVGGGLPVQTLPVEAPVPAQGPQSNGLLAMLQANSRPPPPLPQTPGDQFVSTPPQPPSPHHHHVGRQAHLGSMPPPPPPFGFQAHQNVPFGGPPPPMPQQYSNGAMGMLGRQFVPPRHQHNPGVPAHGPPIHSAPHAQQHGPAGPVDAPHLHSAPHIQQAFNQDALRPYQRIGDPMAQQPPQFPEAHDPAIPPASKLPPPKLTAHTLGLLNAFKGQAKTTPSVQQPSQSVQSSQVTPRMQQPAALHRDLDSFTSPPQGSSSANPYAPSPPPFQSPPLNANFQPVQPKPRSAHQDSLLNLFRTSSAPAVTPPPPKTAEPVELSAHPTTPGYVPLQQSSRESNPPNPDLNIKSNLLEVFGQAPKRPDLTSATVRGPVNVPDFETVKKNAHTLDANAHSRGPSPAQPKSVEQKTFAPQQILKRESAGTTKPSKETGLQKKTTSPSPRSTAKAPTPQPPKPFQPQILKRPQQLPIQAPGPAPVDLRSATATPPGPSRFSPALAAAATNNVNANAFDRREKLPADQKSTLLSLFGKPTEALPLVSAAAQQAPTSKSPRPPQGLTNPPPDLPTLPSMVSSHPKSPAMPPTPKEIVSGVISPVSPLPDKGGSQTDSPANIASRSRISSIGEGAQPNYVISNEARTKAPHLKNGNGVKDSEGDGHVEGGIDKSMLAAGEIEALSGKGKGKSKPASSPVDKSFLLGFLEDVARRGR